MKYAKNRRRRRSNRARRHNRSVYRSRRHNRLFRRRRRNSGRRRHRNPMNLRSIPSAVIGGVRRVANPKFLVGVGSLVAGYYGSQYGLRYLRKLPMVDKIPATGALGYIGDAVLIGASSALLGMASKTAGAAFLVGGSFDLIRRAVAQYVLPAVGLSGMGCVDGMCGMEDYLTPGDAAAARPLGYFGDYLTPGDAAAARPLGGFADDDVGEELAAL